jgi:mono/diheme cytochrome c family protein
MGQIWFLFLFLITSCSNPFDGRGKLAFRDLKQEEIDAAQRRADELRAQEELRRQFLIEKKKAMEAIVADAVKSFEDIRPLITRKCFDCHDANTKLRFYARIFPSINPLYKHQQDGLKALDFSGAYPLRALGNPPQLSLLKSIRNSIIDRTMPLKSYRLVYRSRAINDEDQEKILAWVDPLIQRIEDYEAKYETTSNDVAQEARKIFEQKCFRCHANGNTKGGFGEMEKTENLLRSEYVNPNDPAQSELYTICASGEMPPSKRDALTINELMIIQDWLIQATRNLSIK